jgi:nucleoside-diphosphate-sugar epimerase
MKRALVCGAGGFIGGHLVKRLKFEGYWVRGVDIKRHEYCPSAADEFICGDLRDQAVCREITGDIRFDELYQLAADMGGAGYIFTGQHDAMVMHNSAAINLNMAEEAKNTKIKKVFYSSSACIYPQQVQLDPQHSLLPEHIAYPANPDSEYGWEKLFSERLYLSYQRNYGLEVHVARFHNIFGPEGTWDGGKEKAPAAICRKVVTAADGGQVEIWGDGQQTRTFLFIDECLEGIRRLMSSDFSGPVNIGSDELVSINRLTELAIGFSGKNLGIKHIDGPLGVRGRCADNTLIEKKLRWRPKRPLAQGLEITYRWIEEQVKKKDVRKRANKTSIL